MAATKIQDVIVPEVFGPYVLLRTKELSAFYQSGILSELSEDIAPVGADGGTKVTLPYWNDLTGESEVLSDVNPLTVNNIEAKKDVAVLHARGKAWGANDLAKALSGDDPMGAIADLAANYWNRDGQKILIASLNGAFASPTMADNVKNISAGAGAAAVISGEAIVDAFYLLGDASESLTAMAMHSATHALLIKQGLIEYVRDAEGKLLYSIYMGKRVIIDDGMPVVGGVYTTYLFGAGAIGYRDVGAPVPVETDRDSLQGNDILINRRHFIMHPRGVKWSGPSGIAPSNAGLANAAYWERVYDPKHIRIVAFKHKIA